MEAPTIALALAIYITVKRQGWEACSIRAQTLGICWDRQADIPRLLYPYLHHREVDGDIYIN